MYQEFYRGSSLLHLPLFSLILFLTVFIGTLFWLFVWRRRDPRFERLAAIPLEGDEYPAGGLSEQGSER